MFNRGEKAKFGRLVSAAHYTSGCSLRDLQDMTDVSAVLIGRILMGQCHPPRDTLILLGARGWALPVPEINELLAAAGYHPLTALRMQTDPLSVPA